MQFPKDAMSYNNYSNIKTFKIMKDGNFADADVKWIKSLPNVATVTLQKNTIRVGTEFDDEVSKIVDSIIKRYCEGLNPKLSPLFCVHVHPPVKHKNYLS